MIGKLYQSQLNQLLSESSSTWIDLKTSFDFMYEAAKDFSKETKACHGSQTITTVATQAEYNLNPDFLEVLTKDDHDLPVIKYSDGTNTTWLSWESYSDYLQGDNPDGTPSSFAITDATLVTRITGTVTTGSTNAGGETTLTDTGTVLTSLFPGDNIINTKSDYYGLVLKTQPQSPRQCSTLARGAGHTQTGQQAIPTLYNLLPDTRLCLTRLQILRVKP